MPESLRNRLLAVGLLLLRLSFGLFLAIDHGWPKLVGAYGFWVEGQEWAHMQLVRSLGFPASALLATCSALTESVGGVLLAAGLFTRYAALFVSINMTVAIYRQWLGDRPLELPFLYLAFGVVVLLTGPCSLSVDRMRRRNRPVSEKYK